MSLIVLDRVKETTITTGTSDLVLGGAVAGFQAFSAIGDGNTCYYVIVDGTAWETGIGTYTLSTTTLARTTVLSSSDSGNKLTLAAGSKEVWLDAPAELLTKTIKTVALATTTNYVITTENVVIADYFGTLDITMPAATTVGREIVIKNMAVSILPIYPNGSDLVDDALSTPFSVLAQYASVRLICYAVGKWAII